TPSDTLDAFIEHYWTVVWRLPSGEDFIQETLPYPSVHVAFEPGNSEIVFAMQGRFTRHLIGQGRVFAIKFHPGGFFPFMQAAQHCYLNKRLPVSEVWPDFPISEFESYINTDSDELKLAERLDEALCPRCPPPDENVARVNQLIDIITEAKGNIRSEALARLGGMSLRTLQRLFAQYVGVSPKWVIQRIRLHDALERVQAQPESLTEIAMDLGYADQAHFTRDFKAVVGISPREYLRGPS
ncbi:MAG: helix-turn-helix domain-containing protein, partial [Pseudomonadota bacterium]